MTALESLRIALQSLIGNPLRSLLTLVGIAVGIGAVLHVVSLGEMTQRRIRERLESMGIRSVVLVDHGKRIQVRYENGALIEALPRIEAPSAGP